jgi:hypothetical protein
MMILFPKDKPITNYLAFKGDHQLGTVVPATEGSVVLARDALALAWTIPGTPSPNEEISYKLSWTWGR